MVIIFLNFGYQKWSGYEAEVLTPYISYGPLILSTFTIIPFMPNGWVPSAGGFPEMAETVAFLMKDLVLLAVPFYLLEQDAVRAAAANELPLAWNGVPHTADAFHGTQTTQHPFHG
jgi:uncharacterized membrane protein YkgB